MTDTDYRQLSSGKTMLNEGEDETLNPNFPYRLNPSAVTGDQPPEGAKVTLKINDLRGQNDFTQMNSIRPFHMIRTDFELPNL